jgi:hypothetical protein
MSAPPSFLRQMLHLLYPIGEKKLFPQEMHFMLDMDFVVMRCYL